MATEQPQRTLDTQEFLALWNSAKEDHFVQRLAPLLPGLLGNPAQMNPEHATDAARHIVRALHLASTAESGVGAAIDYLEKVSGT